MAQAINPVIYLFLLPLGFLDRHRYDTQAGTGKSVEHGTTSDASVFQKARELCSVWGEKDKHSMRNNHFSNVLNG